MFVDVINCYGFDFECLVEKCECCLVVSCMVESCSSHTLHHFNLSKFRLMMLHKAEVNKCCCLVQGLLVFLLHLDSFYLLSCGPIACDSRNFGSMPLHFAIKIYLQRQSL